MRRESCDMPKFPEDYLNEKQRKIYDKVLESGEVGMNSDEFNAFLKETQLSTHDWRKLLDSGVLTFKRLTTEDRVMIRNVIGSK